MTTLTLYFPPHFGDPALAGKSKNLNSVSPTVTLGRGPENNIQISIQTVSRQHAVIHYLAPAGGWFLTDTFSRGGTTLNSAPILPGNPEPLAPGDKFWLATPAAQICVLRCEEDTVREERKIPLGPPAEISLISPPPTPDTWPEVAAIAISWFLSGQTARGQAARLGILFLAAIALVALLAVYK